jgi:mono/diheme cytochrome c family protein
MNRKTRTLITLSALLIAGLALAQGRGQRGAAGEQAAAAPAPNLNLPAGDAKRGETNYAKYGCWECHGFTGLTGNGARLATTSLNANGFVNYIRNPRTNQMPLYSAKVISDQEGADLFAYIKTFKKPSEAKDIPLLQQIINEK